MLVNLKVANQSARLPLLLADSAAISHFEAHWTILDGVGEAT